jgi:hypothetical protein
VTDRGRPALIFGASLALGVVLIARLLERSHATPPIGIYVVVLVWLVLLHMVVSIAFREVDWFEFVNVFFFFYVASYVVRPLVLVVRPDQASFSAFWDWHELGSGVFYVALGLAAFSVGYHGPIGVRMAALVPRLGSAVKPRLSAVAFFGMLSLGFGAYLLHAWLLGGVDVFLDNVVYERSQMYFGYGWLVPFQTFALVTIPFGYAYLFSERRLRLSFLMCALALVPLLLVPMSRGAFLTWLVVLVAYRHYAVHRVRLPSLLAASLVALSALVGLQFAREHTFGVVQDVSIGELLLYVYSTTFNGFDSAMMVLSYYQRTGDLLGGATFLEALLYPWIPRALWTAKPLVYGGTAITEPIGGFFSSGTHVTAEVLSELYANFGDGGVLVGLFMVGVAGRALYVACITRSDRSKASLLFYAYVIAMMPGWLRVGLGGSVYYLLTFLGPFLAVLWLVERRPRLARVGAAVRAHA